MWQLLHHIFMDMFISLIKRNGVEHDGYCAVNLSFIHLIQEVKMLTKCGCKGSVDGDLLEPSSESDRQHLIAEMQEDQI